jgi:hypothetical protein
MLQKGKGLRWFAAGVFAATLLALAPPAYAWGGRSFSHSFVAPRARFHAFARPFVGRPFFPRARFIHRGPFFRPRFVRVFVPFPFPHFVVRSAF